MGEFDDGKEKFLQVVKGIDPSVEVVMPVTPSRGMFLRSEERRVGKECRL